MLVNNYKAISNIYNHLMIEIEYQEWADYIYDIYKKNKLPKGYSLELACGNGMVAKYLSPKLQHFIISDKSKEMLHTITEFKSNKICFDMLYLPLKNKYSFIYATFDSINYITDYKKLKLFFKNIDSVLVKGGCFTFDVSLEKNSLIVENELNREGIFNGYHYNQQSKYNKKNRIHENSFIIISPEGKHYEEIHIQKIYKFEDYFKAIDGTKLFVTSCYNSFSFDDAKPTDERVQFILKKG
ncbi:MAG: class I SAM-dependent methyltransferase [bacterium]